MTKFDIAVKEGTEKGKTFHLEGESKKIIGAKIGSLVKGEDIKDELHGYEFEITGASDKAGFASLKNVEGAALKKTLLRYGTGMRQKKPHGLRLKKVVRGNTISADTAQINLVVKKAGPKSISELFGKKAAADVEKKE